MATNSWSRLYQSQLTQPCAVGPLLCNDIGLWGAVGPPEDSNVIEITNYQVNCEQWRVIHISKEFIEWTWVYKNVHCMYSISIAVHRLVLIVNSWDVLGEEQEREVVPILLKQCFAQAWWILPYLFLFYLYFPWVGGVERGVFFCKGEGREELRTMTKRKITFPLEEKTIKKINGCFACS